MDKSTSIQKFVGLDVHKATIAVAVADASGGQARSVSVVAHDVAALEGVLRSLGVAQTLAVVYEAGPTGYGLYRWLAAHGYVASVIAPSLIPRKAGDRIKTDRRDALLLARLARAGELTCISVPDEADEAFRDLTRAREDAVWMRLKARQHLQALLLRNGIRYDGKCRWTQAHERWLATVRLAHPAQQLVFTEYWQSVRRAGELVDRLTAALQEALAGWRWRDHVHALMALRGLDVVSACTVVAEIGDVRRFDHPRELMAYLGLVPREHSSGARVRRGGITKCGNVHARRMLVEAAWTYRFPARVGRGLQRRLEGQSEPIRALSWKAQVRLSQRYRALTSRGLHQNKVCIAIARELTGFIWAMSRLAAPHA